MKWFAGYWRTIRQYWSTEKGRHDIKDYAAALLLVAVTAVIACLAMKLFF